jgi:hypothetical protein
VLQHLPTSPSLTVSAAMSHPPGQSQTYNSYQIIQGAMQCGHGTDIIIDFPQEAGEAQVVGAAPAGRVVVGVQGKPPR